MFNRVIHPDIEPGVIDNAMLIRCVLEQGPKGEAGRLFAEEGVHLNEVTTIRLEFQNILRIDHLWMLTSIHTLCLTHNLIEKIENLHLLTGLVELDLSFNCIENIENLDALINIEVLTLFHNKISKLENMETLDKLQIFSIGDNLLEKFKEVVYLRKFRHLRSVSLKGNPFYADPMALTFLKCALPKVTYLDYVKVTDDDREDGQTLFRGLLNQLEEEDEKRENARLEKEEYNERVEFYALSFVEYLHGPEHFIAMFENDEDGKILLKARGEQLNYYEEYKEQYVEAMEELVQYAQEAYDVRMAEVQAFRNVVNAALQESVNNSKSMIEVYYSKKEPLLEALDELIHKVKISKQAKLEDVDSEVMELVDHYNDVVHDVWKKLMREEMKLFEQCEETRVQFAVNMTALISKLLERSRAAFGLWREYEAVWTVRQSEELTKYVGNKTILGDADPELLEILSDRDILMNSVAQSCDNHMRFIDDREDLFLTRSNGWRDKLIEDTNNNEIKRNRERILEINYFLDNERDEWSEKQMELHETPDPETAALLGEEM